MTRGIGTTRKGSPVLSLQTLIDRIGKKKEAEVRMTEALDAAKVLDQDPRTRMARYRNAAMTGGALKPLVHGVGRAAEAVATAPRGQRIVAGGRALVRSSRGELAKHVAEGAIGGGGIKAVQEGLEVGQAKKKITRFVNEPTKIAEYVNENKEAVRLKHRQAEADIQALPKELRGNLTHTLSKLTMFAIDGIEQDEATINRLKKTAGKKIKGQFVQYVKAHMRSKKAAESEHYRNTCPECKGVRQCRCSGARVETREVCSDCKGKIAGDKKVPAKSLLTLKPVASPDFDFEV